VVTGKWIVCSAAVLLSASMWVSAEDPAPAAPATQPAETHMRGSHKLVEPWKDLKDLTPEQTDQIIKLHSDADIQRDKIKKKETDDIMAILTPAQVTELKMAEQKAHVTMREKAKARREKKPTTAPAE
jgi:Spy/CpxP family protein refolding chaperone